MIAVIILKLENCDFIIRAMSWENLFMLYVNNKGADQPAHPCSLIRAFVVHCLDTIISLVSIICNFKPLPSFCGCTGRFVSYLVTNPKDRFSRDEAHTVMHPKDAEGVSNSVTVQIWVSTVCWHLFVPVLYRIFMFGLVLDKYQYS